MSKLEHGYISVPDSVRDILRDVRTDARDAGMPSSSSVSGVSVEDAPQRMMKLNVDYKQFKRQFWVDWHWAERTLFVLSWLRFFLIEIPILGLAVAILVILTTKDFSDDMNFIKEVAVVIEATLIEIAKCTTPC